MSVRLEHGDCLDVMRRLAAEGVTVDSVVTDPPYHLTSIVKRFGGASRGFMGKQWDGGDIAFRPETWALAYDLLPPGGHLLAFSGTRTYHRMVCAIEDAGFDIRDQLAWVYGSGFPKSHNVQPFCRIEGRQEFHGFGTALKPSWEPIVLARKPLQGTVAGTVLAYGTGALNIDGCRIEAPEGLTSGGSAKRPPHFMDAAAGKLKERRSDPHSLGRWPANIVHDGSEEAVAAFPASDGGGDIHRRNGAGKKTAHTYGDFNDTDPRWAGYADSGSASRFFYSAKADADDRLGSKHPTVKPVDLMAWLCRLVTPPGGTVLDPFAGSGSTGMACLREGFNSILIEREAEYVADIRRRIAHVSGGDTPLFAESAE